MYQRVIVNITILITVHTRDRVDAMHGIARTRVYVVSDRAIVSVSRVDHDESAVYKLDSHSRLILYKARIRKISDGYGLSKHTSLARITR